MKILVARHAGFCGGVQRAVEMALAAAAAGPLYALGPPAHNESLLERLRHEGVVLADDLSDVPDGAAVLIRTHGVRPEILDLAAERKLTVLDATCPFVKQLQNTAADLVRQGKQVVIAGDANHPEIQGVMGFGQDQPVAAESAGEIGDISLDPARITAVVAQTTQRESILYEIGEKLKLKVPVVEIYNTICRSAALRQEAARSLAKEADVMVVVGGRHSANTRKLADVCREEGTKTIVISSADELEPGMLRGAGTVGLTAGASTPDWTIKEVIAKMENEKNMEQQQEQLAAEDVSLGQEVREFSVGDVVGGTVVQVSEDEVLVDIGYKSEGVLPRQEIIAGAGQALSSVLQVGQKIDVVVKKIDNAEGKVILSRKAVERKQKWQELELVFSQGTTIAGKVKEAVQAGLVVDLGGGFEGFMPGSLVDIRFVPDFKEFLGKEIEFKVAEMRRDKEKLILSRKQVIEEKQAAAKEKVFNEIKPGQIIRGTVKRLTGFGAFVDVGGIDGLVHVSEISWHRIENPSEVLAVGDEVTVKVLEVIPERERIGLSLRQAQPGPWSELSKKFAVGDVVNGKVTRLVDFGVFVELLPGVEGLVHISQLANYHVKQASEVVSQGDAVKVKILDINPDAKRVSLSMRESAPRPSRRETVKEAGPQAADNNSGLTLGDVFGSLFDLEKEKK